MLMSEKKVKVCHLTSAHPESDIRIFHKECKSLSNDSLFDVYLVAVNAKESNDENVTIVSAESKSKNRLIRIFNSSRKVFLKALEIDADIYHFHDPELLPYGLKLRKKGKIVIYDAHEDVPRQILGKPWIPFPLRKIISYFFEKYENYVSSRLSFIITSTPTIEKRYLKINKNSSAICNYPILTENGTLPLWETRENTLCYVGGITEIRGIREIIKVLEADPTLILNLAGEFSPPSLKEDIIKMKGWKQVNYFGVVDRNKVVEILNQSKIGIVTLHPKQNYLDSLPIKMFEYMYAGMPVIASDFPLWKQIIGKNSSGFCVDPFDIKSTLNLVHKLLKDQEGAKIMGESGRMAVIKEYNWSIEGEKLVQIYRQLL
jgi:glycosyltransferase involved in cell wall biosynthesis